MVRYLLLALIIMLALPSGAMAIYCDTDVALITPLQSGEVPSVQTFHPTLGDSLLTTILAPITIIHVTGILGLIASGILVAKLGIALWQSAVFLGIYGVGVVIHELSRIESHAHLISCSEDPRPILSATVFAAASVSLLVLWMYQRRTQPRSDDAKAAPEIEKQNTSAADSP